MYEAIIRGINQARKFGFHAQELADAKKNILSGAERAARGSATRYATWTTVTPRASWPASSTATAST